MKLTETISLTKQKDGFWLYDYTRGMNLAMRAETEQAAFIEALEYYQRRTKAVETKLRALETLVEGFNETTAAILED